MTSFTVHCTHCETGFPVDPDKVPDGGVRARCTKCEGIFFVAKPADRSPSGTAVAEPEVEIAETEPAEPVGAPPDAAETIVEEPEVGETIVAEPDSTEPVVTESDVMESDATKLEVAEEDEMDTLEVETDIEPFDDEVSDDEVAHAESSDDDSDQDRADSNLDDVGFGSFDDEVDAIGTELTVESATGVDTPSIEDEDEVAPVPTGFQFGKRDPHDKARRLARVLVSDMITYNPDRHAQALARGTLQDDFEDEIAKSWQEYVDQVGRDMAESTDYWTNALNDVLARGEKVF